MNSLELNYLLDIAKNLPQPYSYMCLDVINDRRFQLCPGGAEKHHAYEGGLVDHTAEVVRNARSMVTTAEDLLIVTVAAIFHDRNKIFEYRFDKELKIEKLPYRNLIGHVTGSWQYFMQLLRESYLIPNDIRDEISHCMLAHHGRLEWRSPVQPQTKLAHILHTADMMSFQGASNGPFKQNRSDDK